MSGGVFFLAMLLMVSVMAAGCGDEKEEAKEYAVSGDSYYKMAIGIMDDIEQNQEMLTASIGEELTQQMIDDFTKSLEELEDVVLVYTDNLSLALEAYSKIEGLKGAEDYEEYASLKKKAIGKREEEVAYLEKVSAALAEMFEDIQPGDTLSVEALMKLSSMPEFEKLMAIGDEIEKLEKEAADLASSKKLF